MRLIERRIGLLFAGFLLCFTIVLGRAFWLQGVQGSTLASQAVSQQEATVMVPGLRGRILDRRGRELAVSEDAAIDLRHALPGQASRAHGGQAGAAARPRPQRGAESR